MRLASGVRVEWVMDVAEPLLDLTSSLEWNRTGGVVETVSRIALGSVVLEESRGPAGPSAEATALLLRSLAPAELGKSAALGELTRRLDLLRSALPELEIPALGDEAVAALIADAAGGATRRADVEALDLGALLVSSLPPPVRVALERDAPERLTLAQGRALPIHYEADRPPWVESRLQDFFGMVRTPTLCRGRVPLTVHLLAPNHRAVQVTTDLAGFWERHYPGIRRELCRRYPRHPWPEDGRTASPPEPRRRP